MHALLNHLVCCLARLSVAWQQSRTCCHLSLQHIALLISRCRMDYMGRIGYLHHGRAETMFLSGLLSTGRQCGMLGYTSAPFFWPGVWAK